MTIIHSRIQSEKQSIHVGGRRARTLTVESDFDELQLSAALRRVLDYLPRRPQQRPNLAPVRDCLGRVEAMLEGVLVTLRRAR
jgi:hypothetical protein